MRRARDEIEKAVTMQAWPYPLWIAHRGAGKLAPENTLAAFRIGAAHGYRAFECDVKLSADGVPFLLHYVTSKGAIVALTRALAKELGKDNVLVNCVAPGFTMSAAGCRKAPAAAMTLSVPACWSTGSATVNWVPPLRNTDGSALTNLAGFQIHFF